MKNNYLFDEAPVKIYVNESDESKMKLNVFLEKYPDMKDRIELDNGEILFLISENKNLSERDWTVDFLESNVNKGRNTNGEGVVLTKEFYQDLFDLFEDDGIVYFESGNDFCAMETVGSFDCRYHFRINRDGLHWEEDD